MADNIPTLLDLIRTDRANRAEQGQATPRHDAAIAYLTAAELDVFAWPRAIRDAFYATAADDFTVYLAGPLTTLIATMANGANPSRTDLALIRNRLARCTRLRSLLTVARIGHTTIQPATKGSNHVRHSLHPD